MSLVFGLALYAAYRQVSKQSLLEDGEKYAYRQRRHNDCSHSRRDRRMVEMQRVCVGVHNRVQADCNRRIAGHKYHRRLIIVPEEYETNKQNRQEGVFEQRQCNLEKDLEIVRPVNFRRFREGSRQRLTYIVEHEEIQTEEVCLHYPQAPNFVHNARFGRYDDFRRQAADDGYHHNDNNKGVDKL